MSTEENKAVVRRITEAVNDHNFDVLDELLTPEMAREFRGMMQWIDATFEGHHIDITDILAEGDQVWTRVATRGGHTGEFEGISATGKQWTNSGVLFFRLADGRIAAMETLFDVFGHVKKLGATITPPALANI